MAFHPNKKIKQLPVIIRSAKTPRVTTKNYVEYMHTFSISK